MGRLVHLDRNTLTKKQTDFVDMFLFSFYSCGLRVSDIITLRWCDINFEKKEIDKTQVKTRGRNFVPLTDEGLKILESWQGKNRIFVFGLLPDNFNLDDEEELRIRRNSITSTINKSLKRLSEIAQLDKKVTFHMSRHSWAVNALEQGMPLTMISSLLGHSSTMITEKVYAQWTQNTKAEAVKNLKFNF
jgi:integrase